MTFLFTSQRHAGHFAEPYLCRLFVTYADMERVYREAKKYDVVWCEWGGAYTRQLLREDIDGFVMVRVHDAEVRTGTVKLLDWSQVDCVWFINEQTQADFNGLVDYPREKQFYLPNAIDLREWPLVAEGEKHIGLVAVNTSERKRIDRAVELMKFLPDYQLTVRTSRPVKTSLHNVRFDLRKFDKATVTDKREMVEFWRGKSHVICTSDHEAFCYAFAEGMACGAAGTTWDWEWGNASTFYPGLVSGSLEEMAERVTTTLPGKWWRRQVERFDADVLTPRLVAELEDRI